MSSSQRADIRWHFAKPRGNGDRPAQQPRPNANTSRLSGADRSTQQVNMLVQRMKKDKQRQAMERGASGVLHVANQGQASWHEVAERLFVEARDQGQNLGDLELHETTTERYGARARRPRYSVLDLNRCHKTYGVTLPDWRDGLTRAVESYA